MDCIIGSTHITAEILPKSDCMEMIEELVCP